MRNRKSIGTSTEGLDDDILSYRWRGKRMVKTEYGEIPQEVYDIGERIRIMVDGLLGSLEFSLCNYFLPLSLIIYFVLATYSFQEQKWLSLIFSTIIFVYSNMIVIDLKRVAINKFSKKLKNQATLIEMRLRKTDFFLDMKVSYKLKRARQGELGGVIRQFEMLIFFKRKVLKGNCLRKTIKLNKIKMKKKNKEGSRGILGKGGSNKKLKTKVFNVKRSGSFLLEPKDIHSGLVDKDRFEINIDGDDLICFKPKNDIVDSSHEKALRMKL